MLRNARMVPILRASCYHRFFHRGIPTLGHRVTIHIRGHARGGSDAWITEAYATYSDRLRTSGLDLVTIWHKTDDQLVGAVEKEKAPTICLDERGQSMSSTNFSQKIFKKLEEGGSRLCFVIGGAEGLPGTLRPQMHAEQGRKRAKYQQAAEHLSLSPMTFTHQMARVLLAEQLYRASEITRGSKYHKV